MALHHKDEFLGLTVDEAEAWATALGWTLRVRAQGGLVTDDVSADRLSVWADGEGRVAS